MIYGAGHSGAAASLLPENAHIKHTQAEGERERERVREEGRVRQREEREAAMPKQNESQKVQSATNKLISLGLKKLQN